MKFEPDIAPSQKKKPEIKKEEIDELDEETKQKVSLWSQEWLDNFYSNPNFLLEDSENPDTAFDFSRKLNTDIARMVGKIDSFNDGLINKKYAQGVEIFLNTFFDFVEKKSLEGKEQKKLANFIASVDRLLFSISPSILNVVGLDTLLIKTARATRISEIQGWIGQMMVGEMVYELNWTDEKNIQSLLNKILNCDLPEQLDLVNQLTTIAAQAIADGHIGDNAKDRIVWILERINQRSSSYILRYATENALEVIEKEEEDPSLSVITFSGNVAGSRLSKTLDEKLADQNETLKRQINISNKKNKDYKLLQIASDAAGVFDHSNTPRQFTQIDFSRLPKPTENNNEAIEGLKETAESKLNINDFLTLLIYVSEDILLNQNNLEDSTPEIISEKWHSISSVFPKEEWKRVFTVLIKKVKLEDEKEERIFELQEKTKRENSEASEKFVELVVEKGKNIIDTIPEVPSLLIEHYENLTNYTQEGNEERAFVAAEEFVNYFRMSSPEYFDLSQNPRDIPKHKNPDVRELQEALESLERFHSDNWQTYKKETDSLNSQEENEEEIKEFLSVKNLIANKQEQLQVDILNFLKDLSKKIKTKLVGVEVKQYSQIETDPDLNPFLGKGGEQLALLLQNLHNPTLRNFIEQDLNIELSTIPLRSQIHLLRFLAEQNQGEFNKLRNILQKKPTFKKEFLNSFLITAEDLRFGQTVIGLAETLSSYPEIGTKVFQTYDQYIAQVSEVAKKVLIDLQQEFPNLSLNENIIIQSLLSRAKDFMVELETSIKSKPEQAEIYVNNFTAELNKELPKEQVVRAQFKTIASLLDRENIDLKTFEKGQEMVLGSLIKGTMRASFLQTLNRMGKLSPIPEIHWRVDRSNEEYSRRLGINLVQFLQDNAVGSKRKKILLEIGPGSGMAKKERASLNISENYQDIALSDKLYYPLSSVIEKIIDYTKLEKEIAKETGQVGNIELTLQERGQLADFIYKVLIIKEGQTSSDTFLYDEQNQALLTQDINNLREIISSQLATRLRASSEVPDTISMHRGGKVVYPYKLKTSSWSPALQVAKKLLEGNPTQFMRANLEQTDCYSLIDAFPANVMVGDLSQIEKLKTNQIDVELAVRSTVYKDGEEYIKFLQQLIDRLSDGGVAIDDSIRDNDGWYYRIAEVLEAKEKTKKDVEILVILGPGFPGEDKRQDKVPLSMIITKKGSSENLIRKNLLAGYEIIKLEDLISQNDYLESLDDTGLTKRKITQMEMVG